MGSGYLLYSSIWCPVDEVKICVDNGRHILKGMIDFVREYGDEEGITFLELTEDALRNLPVLMVDKMKCFNKDNLDTMAFSIKEIKCGEEYIENLRNHFCDSIKSLLEFGFNGEVIILREVRIQEENIGKTVGKKEYEVFYHKGFCCYKEH